MGTYTVASEEGAQRYGVAVGEQVDLDLSKQEQLALVAAGWLEPEQKAKEAKK